MEGPTVRTRATAEVWKPLTRPACLFGARLEITMSEAVKAVLPTAQRQA